jgi:6,7-dimethyl-8-ribityllumazine synthase
MEGVQEMPNEYRAVLDAKNKRVAIVVSRFNEHVTRRLVDGAVDCLVRHGGDESAIDVYWVSGAFELPQAAAKIIKKTDIDGVLVLGALIRGETSHFDVLAGTVARSMDSLATHNDTPIAFGVITADTLDQAIDRAGGKHGNQGWHSALSLIDLMNLWKD